MRGHHSRDVDKTEFGLRLSIFHYCNWWIFLQYLPDYFNIHITIPGLYTVNFCFNYCSTCPLATSRSYKQMEFGCSTGYSEDQHNRAQLISLCKQNNGPLDRSDFRL